MQECEKYPKKNKADEMYADLMSEVSE